MIEWVLLVLLEHVSVQMLMKLVRRLLSRFQSKTIMILYATNEGTVYPKEIDSYARIVAPILCSSLTPNILIRLSIFKVYFRYVDMIAQRVLHMLLDQKGLNTVILETIWYMHLFLTSSNPEKEPFSPINDV